MGFVPWRKRLGVRSTHTHDIKCEAWVNRLRPPRSNVPVFLPKVTLALTNQGEAMEYGQVDPYVAPFDGPVGEMSVAEPRFTDLPGFRLIRGWESGERKKFRITFSEVAVPKPGTYILRVLVSKRVPVSPEVAERWVRALRTVPSAEYTEIIQAMGEGSVGGESILEVQPPKAYRMVGILKLTPVHYFKVHSLGVLVGFFALVSSLVLGLAALILTQLNAP